MSQLLDRAAIEDEIATVAAALSEDDDLDDDGQDLGIPGAETILILVASKLILPVFTGLMGKAAGAKYRELRTRRDIDAAIAELDGAPVATAHEAVDLSALHREVVAMAVAEGVDPRLAEAVVGKTVSRLHERYFRAE
ncbi:hypothetical protein [Actinospica robiniae]|uniref:hypothetical protein n=1 Tax=Actinospica robiniae TaxID=304901 RepID=UPI00042A4F0F|nr:hypothetical protein [Actinospica robiniae]